VFVKSDDERLQSSRGIKEEEKSEFTSYYFFISSPGNMLLNISNNLLLLQNKYADQINILNNICPHDAYMLLEDDPHATCPSW